MNRLSPTTPARTELGAVEGAASKDWRRLLAGLDFAFQPIIQLQTGRCHGFEAILCGLERTSFNHKSELSEAAWRDGALSVVEATLQARALERFIGIGGADRTMLFLSADARAFGLVHLPNAGEFGVNVEIDHLGDKADDDLTSGAMELCRRAGLGVVLDDFGGALAGLKLLYAAKPDYVRINRFFLEGIDRDVRRRAIVQYLVKIAHVLGILVIAEGIENEGEFYICRDLGFDFGQGYLIGEPKFDITSFPQNSTQVEALNHNDRRRPIRSHRSLSEVIERLPPLMVNVPKTELLAYFAGGSASMVAPVVDARNRPLGMVRERDLKRFTYTRFGGELLRNKEVGNNLADLVTAAPVCEVTTPLEQVIEAFSLEDARDGMLFVENGEYVGFLSPPALIRLVHEHNLALAADQNPLTRLPGNTAIVRHIERVIEDNQRPHCLAYFDFDNFKPFNDGYGFRQGDRAIQMFADRMKALAKDSQCFAGHIGGDDFFIAFSGVEPKEAYQRLCFLADHFRSDAESLYDPATRAAGFLLGKDRDGNQRAYPLLSVTGVALVIPPGQHSLSADVVNQVFASQKAEAKHGSDRVRMIRITGDGVAVETFAAGESA